MAMNEYDVEFKELAVASDVNEKVELRLIPSEPEEISGTGNFSAKIKIKMSKKANGRLHLIPDLKLQILLNNVPFGGELDFAGAEAEQDIVLSLGRTRVSASIVGFGAAVTTTASITKKVVAAPKVNPDKFDAYFTGGVQIVSAALGMPATYSGPTINIQTWPAKAGYEVTLTRDDRSDRIKLATDNRGFAFYPDPAATPAQSPIVVTRPTVFRMVCPVHESGQGPEELCLIPPPVGMPKWAKYAFFGFTGLFFLSILLLFLGYNFLPGWNESKLVNVSAGYVGKAQDWMHDWVLRAENTRPAADLEMLGFVRFIRSSLWFFFWGTLFGTIASTVAAFLKAALAVRRNWKYLRMENRLGAAPPTTLAAQPAQAGAQVQSATNTLTESSSSLYSHLWEIAKEIIAEAFVDASARTIRAVKLTQRKTT